MFRYLMVTREQLTTFSTSPLLPVGVTNGGALRAIVDVSEPATGPLSPEHPANDVLVGGSPVMTRLNSPLIRTGSPVHRPWTLMVLVGAEAEVLVLATTA